MKKIILLLICNLIAVPIIAQDTVYLNDKKQKVSKAEAVYFKIKNSGIKQSPFYDTTYLLNGAPKSITIYKNQRKTRIIKHSVWYDSGKPYMIINYRKGKKEGEFLTLWENGKTRRKDLYKKGRLINGSCWNENGVKITYFEYEKQPEFPGGSKEFTNYFQNNLSSENTSNTRIVVKFFINCNGEISDPQIIKKSNNLSLNMRVLVAIINMPKWKPAEQDGKTVGVWRTLPLKF